MSRYFIKEKRKQLFGRTLIINPQTAKDVYLLHQVTQTFVKKISHFVLAQRICTIAENNAEKLENLENLKSRISESPLNTTKRLTKI